MPFGTNGGPGQADLGRNAPGGYFPQASRHFADYADLRGMYRSPFAAALPDDRVWKVLTHAAIDVARKRQRTRRLAWPAQEVQIDAN